MNKNSKIYIAGHTGLVGSALVKSLLSKGYSNIIGKTIEEMDLRDPISVKSFFDQEKPEYVILAAAKVGGIVANNIYRAEFIWDNLMIQNNIIEQAYRNKVKKLLFLGSTCIYPKECPQPMKEEYLLSSPLEYTNEPYAIAKIAGIKTTESYNLQYSTNYISVMPTNLYGPNDNFDLEKSHVLPALIRKIHLGKCLEENNWIAIIEDLNKRPIESVDGSSSQEDILAILSKYGVKYEQFTSHSSHLHSGVKSTKEEVIVEIWGSGKPKREFLYSEEMADACVYVMENVDFVDLVKAGAKGQLVDKSKEKLIENCRTVEELKNNKIEIRNTHINIGTGKEVTIRYLAETVKSKIGFKGELFFNTEKPDGTMRKLTDPSKLHKLGWHHKIELEEGIDYIYKWYHNYPLKA
jgi:GDP-L-fucose synthase